jgi:hypothetical protein
MDFESFFYGWFLVQLCFVVGISTHVIGKTIPELRSALELEFYYKILLLLLKA